MRLTTSGAELFRSRVDAVLRRRWLALALIGAMGCADSSGPEDRLRVDFQEPTSIVYIKSGVLHCTVTVRASASGGPADSHALWSHVAFTFAEEATGRMEAGELSGTQAMEEFWGTDRILPGQTLTGTLPEIPYDGDFEVELTVAYNRMPGGALETETLPAVPCRGS